MLLWRLRELELVSRVRPLMRFEFFAGILGIEGSIVVGKRNEASDTGVRSAIPWVGGTGNDISAP
jgi:hypothetical protein